MRLGSVPVWPIVSAALSCASLAACGGGSDEGMGPGRGGEGGGLAALAGLYDATATFDEETDVIYIEIRADSTLVVHDYQMDGFGTGANCWASFGPVTLVPLGGILYARSDDPDARIGLARGDAGALYVEQESFETVNGFPQTIVTVDQYPPLAGVSPTDLTPCSG